MQSIATNNEKETLRRPGLTVNTNLRKKKWNSLFSSRDKIKVDTLTPASTLKKSMTDRHMKNDSVSSIPASLEEDFENLTTASPDNLDDASVHSNHSNHSVQNGLFKKFHVPHFNLRTHSQPTPTRRPSCDFTPVAPEPIMPEFVSWSPEALLSPPPWELHQKEEESKTQDFSIFQPTHTKRHSMGLPSFGRYDESDSIGTIDSSMIVDYHSDFEIPVNDKRSSSSSSTSSFSRTSESTLVNSPSNNKTRVRRHSSCPSYDTLSLKSSSTAVENNDIISITEQHTRTSVFKKYTHPVDKKPALKSCQKAKARAAEAAANGTTVQPGNSLVSTFCEDNLKYLYIPNVFDPVTREPVLEFSSVKPRKYQLHRKTSWKREAKALMTWHHALEESVSDLPEVEKLKSIPDDKKERYNLTRKFIAREIYVTEVNFWNHLYYTKVIYYDAVCNALKHASTSVKESDADQFANLFDLMQFSAKLINRLRHFQLGPTSKCVDSPPLSTSADSNTCPDECCSDLLLGKAMREMAEDFVVFLRCALDYRENRKILENSVNNKSVIRYRQKLRAQKETSQFTMEDYLIIPIQRVARYGLLIADLIKHSEPTYPDYKDLVVAHKIVTSLAFAMNSVQKKKKKT